ncbi:hypothetical protein K502DRAFT_324794 [Neoconidiobolus thromboides FSU 785]|nr:hypothetical protein K502DRAFT_324794 [Neoconidiobolus thromboides FSU 785]
MTKKNKEGNKERFKGKPNSAKKKSEPFGNKPVQILKAVKPNPTEHEEKPGKPNNTSNNGPKPSNAYSNVPKLHNTSNNGSKPKESINNGSKPKEGLKNKGETSTPRKVFLVENGKIAPDGGSSNNNRFKGQRHYRKPENKT